MKIMNYMNYILLLKSLVNSSYLVLATLGYEDVQKGVTTLVSIIGGGVALMGAIDGFSGYSNQSSGKQSEGVIKFIGGAGIILVGNVIIKAMFTGLE